MNGDGIAVQHEWRPTPDRPEYVQARAAAAEEQRQRVDLLYHTKGGVSLLSDEWLLSCHRQTAEFIVGLLVAWRWGWTPAGTAEPGGQSVASATGFYRVAAGSYVLGTAAKVFEPDDAFRFAVALNRCLRGDRPSQTGDNPPAILLGADESENHALLRASVSAFHPKLISMFARLAWYAPLRITAPVGTGYRMLV